jgi:hypothetical protein
MFIREYIGNKRIAVGPLQELDLSQFRPRQHFFRPSAVLQHRRLRQSLEAHSAQTNQHTRLIGAVACALQCSSSTVSTVSTCGDCNAPVIRTFLPRNVCTRAILVSTYAWGLDSSVRKNISLQSTIFPITTRCPLSSEALEHSSAKFSAIRGGVVARRRKTEARSR